MSDQEKAEPVRVTVDEAKEMLDAGEAVVLDVVEPEVYDRLSVQIAGAVRIDPRDVPDKYEKLPKDKIVLSY